jgi:hypothetical protein
LRQKIDNIYRNIQIQFLKYNGQQRVSLQVFCVPLVPQNEGEYITLELAWAEQSIAVEQPLLTGGQSILLSEAIAQTLVDALLQGHCVEVRIGRYSSTIDPEGFLQAYTTYQKL